TGSPRASLSRFFFQAEDGIRDFHVTGVQTCALPISLRPRLCAQPRLHLAPQDALTLPDPHPHRRPLCAPSNAASSPLLLARLHRSEERRVGKECSSRWTRYE